MHWDLFNMRGSSNRSQAALEFIFTHGWSMIIVLAVGFTLWQLGVFSFSTGTYTAEGFGNFKPVLAGSMMNETAYSFNMLFVNAAGRTMTIRDITAVNVNEGWAYCFTGAKNKESGVTVIFRGGGCWENACPADQETPAVGVPHNEIVLIHAEDRCNAGGTPGMKFFDLMIDIEYDIFLDNHQTVRKHSRGTIHGPYVT